MRDRPIPYWVEKEASAFRKMMRGEVASDEIIDDVRGILYAESDKHLANRVKARRDAKREQQQKKGRRGIVVGKNAPRD